MQIGKKQHVLLILTLAAFGYLGFQLYGLLRNEEIANAAEQSDISTRLEIVAEAPRPATLQPAPLATGQKAYLTMVNQYELAKMKRRLLEERAAIAAAQHRIAMLDKQTRELDGSLAKSIDLYDDTQLKKETTVPQKKRDKSKVTVTPGTQKPKVITITKKLDTTGLDQYTDDERSILAMPANTFTIQLIGSYHRDIVENFAIANDLGNRAMQFYVMNRGKRWYVLLYGNYPSRTVAQTALRDLPPALSPEHPWVRSVMRVQRDIKYHKHHVTSQKKTPLHKAKRVHSAGNDTGYKTF